MVVAYFVLLNNSGALASPFNLLHLIISRGRVDFSTFAIFRMVIVCLSPTIFS